MSKLHPLALLVASSTLLLSACGGGSSSGGVSDTGSSNVSLRFSDAPVENAKEVVITVDKIIFEKAGTNVEVDTFKNADTGIEEDTFQIDLLTVQGNDSKLVLDNVTLPVGEVQNLRLKILDNESNASIDLDKSYVLQSDSGEYRALKVPSDELKLGGFEVTNKSTQTFVVEFGLRESMTYNPGPDRYILKPRGVRVVALEDAATIAGTLDLAALHLDTPCSDKPDSTVDNVAYLYQGHGLDTSKLSDAFVSESMADEGEAVDADVPADRIAPTISTSVDADGNYLFSYVLPGDYTLGFACRAGDDDPVIWNEVVVPSPSTAIIELSASDGESKNCTLSGTPACTTVE